ncbi:phage tail tape measure protein [Sulfitobacter pseudonitzschiae]|uniref:Phage tail tape measure protein n=1 Tax=Pseudosulfitobacter pseudonitzschiae TaxID=1402135 RepID=A0A9Q2NRH4_9RHOB|nr:phage tail tape measure protein [Pseudosulfitobacter pseudonitzschiae]MBM2293737.1 phage tail tape measure protein [Pseudosulfitobacter pseudonitzschiae]MBM2298655.1 phage tail tape measure protein [Pseudosulfitobacter pseudonitzschiae]MBM2303569.1 phage tail tape measure protein [Pseudosulfitobacter pseudonitzschiae]MBM2313352.1 phage tail tape measure protein [Pseudosulfitobacter pseudonitzschiae]MBM2318265.1 phage tail tape measure protein [Pseudosulfitobacter pseudonitzschiae]
MTDLALLGFDVDSRRVKAGTNDLRDFGDEGARTDRKVKKATDSIDKSFGLVGKTMKSLTIVAAGAFAALSAAAGVSASTSNMLSFGSALSEVSTLIEGTARQTAYLEAESRKLAATYGGTGTEQARAFYQAISAGAKSVEDAGKTLDVANQLAIGGVTDTATAVGILSTAVNVYASSGLTAAEASDAIFVAVKAGVTTVGELSSALGKVLPLAKEMGLSFDETAAATAALTKGGLSTSEAVTGLRAALVAALGPTKQASDLAAELGLDFSVAAVEAQGFAAFMADVVAKTGGSAEQLQVLFGSVEAVGAALAFSGSAGEFMAQILGDMETKAGATSEAFNKMSKDMQERLNVVMGKAWDLSASLGSVLLTALVPAMEAAASVAGKVAENADVLAVSLGILAVTRIPALIGVLTTFAGSMAVTEAMFIAGAVASRSLAIAMSAIPFVAVVTALTSVYRAYGDARARSEEYAAASEALAASKNLVNEQLGIYIESRAPAAKSAIMEETKELIKNARASLIVAEANMKMFETHRNGMNPALRNSEVMEQAAERAEKYRIELDGLQRTLAALASEQDGNTVPTTESVAASLEKVTAQAYAAVPSLVELQEQYGASATAVKSLMETQNALAVQDTANSIDTLAASAAAMADKLQLSEKQAADFQQAMSNIREMDTFAQQAEALGVMADYLIDARGGVQNLDAETRGLVISMLEASKSAAEVGHQVALAEANSTALGRAIASIAPQFAPAIGAANALARALGGVLAQLGGIARGLAAMSPVGTAIATSIGSLGTAFKNIGGGALQSASKGLASVGANLKEVWGQAQKSDATVSGLSESLSKKFKPAAVGGGSGGASGASKELARSLREAEREAKALKTAMDRPLLTVIDGAASALGDFVTGQIKSFADFGKAIFNSIASAISQAVSFAVANPIKVALGLTGGLTGGGGSGAAATGGAPGGGGPLGGILGKIGGIGSSFISGASGLVTSLMGGGGLSAAGTYLSSVLGTATTSVGAFAAAAGAIALPLAAVAAVFSFFKKKVKELDSGLRITADSMSTMVEQFTKTETKRFWGLSKKVRETYSPAENAEPIIQAVDAIQTEAQRLGGILGLTAGSFDSFAYSIRLSLKGLSEDEAQAKIQETFGEISDQYAYAALGWFQENIGDVIRDGQTADQALSELAGSLQGVNAVMGQLRLSTDEMSVAGAIASRNFADLFGGLDALNQVATSYYQNFYSDAERLGHATELLTEQMGALFLSVPATKDAFRALVEAADAAGDREMVAALLQISPLFTQVTDATESAADAQGALTAALTAYEQAVGREIARLRTEAATALEPLLAGIAEAEADANAARTALDGAMSSLRSFVQAQISAVSDAAEAAIDPLQSELEALQARAENASDALETAMDALVASVDAQIDSINTDLESAVTTLEGVAQAAVDTSDRMREVFEGTFSALMSSLDAQSEAISTSYASRIDSVSSAMESASSNAGDLADKLRMIEAALSSRGPISEAAELLAYRQAQQELRGFANGGAFSARDLERVLAGVSQPTENFFGNRFDYELDFAKTSADLRKLQEATEGTLSIDEQQLELLNAQIAILEAARDQELSAIQAQRDQAQALYDATVASINGQQIGNASLAGLQTAANEYLAAAANAAAIEEQTTAEITALRDVAAAQVSELQAILAAGRAQYAAATGTTNAVVGVDAAVDGLAVAVTGYTAAQDALSVRQDEILAEIAAIEAARDAEIATLEAQLDTAQALYDTATGQATTLTSIDAHMGAFNATLAEYTAAQVTLADVMAINQPLIDSINATLAEQTGILEAQLASFQDQFAPLSDLPTALATLQAAIQALADAQANVVIPEAPQSLLSSQLDAIYNRTLGRDADAAGEAYYTGQVLSGGRSLADIEAELLASQEYRADVFRPQLDSAYQAALGRAADQAGADYYYQQFMGGRSIADIAAELAASPEAIPSYATGTNNHPGGLAYVHKDELINMPRGSSVSTVPQTAKLFDNSELVAEVRALRETVSALHREAQVLRAQVARNTKNIADDVDEALTEGMPVAPVSDATVFKVDQVA